MLIMTSTKSNSSNMHLETKPCLLFIFCCLYCLYYIILHGSNEQSLSYSIFGLNNACSLYNVHCKVHSSQCILVLIFSDYYSNSYIEKTLSAKQAMKCKMQSKVCKLASCSCIIKNGRSVNLTSLI